MVFVRGGRWPSKSFRVDFALLILDRYRDPRNMLATDTRQRFEKSSRSREFPPKMEACCAVVSAIADRESFVPPFPAIIGRNHCALMSEGIRFAKRPRPMKIFR